MPATIYMETYGLSLRKSGGVFRILRNNKKLEEIPAIMVDSIMVSNEGTSISGGAVGLCMEHNIPIFFMPKNRAQPSVLSPVESKWPERMAAQIRLQENPEKIFALAKAFVTGKIRNQLSLITYFKNSGKLKDKNFISVFDEHKANVSKTLKLLETYASEKDIKLLRGKFFSAEGRCASSYWECASFLIPRKIKFPGRKRKGAKDIVNSMLNYSYAILEGRVYKAIILSGLSSYFSILHAPRQGRPSLVFDLIEEFRPWAVDRVVFRLIKRKHDFSTDKNGRLEKYYRRMLIENLEKQWKKYDLNRLLKKQAELLCKSILEQEKYKPVIFNSNGVCNAIKK